MERVKYENQFFAQGQWKDIDTTCWDEKGEAGLVRKKKIKNLILDILS